LVAISEYDQVLVEDETVVRFERRNNDDFYLFFFFYTE
jgi:hypothetical protein